MPPPPEATDELEGYRSDSRRYEWRPHRRHANESLLWRGTEQAGSFEWSDEGQVRGVGEIMGQDLVCARDRYAGMSVTVGRAGADGPTLTSRLPGWRRRLIRADAGLYRWTFDPPTRSGRISEVGVGELISYRPKANGDMDGWDMFVARRILTDPEAPFLVGFGWFMVVAPVGGIVGSLFSFLNIPSRHPVD